MVSLVLAAALLLQERAPVEWPADYPFDRHTTTDRYGRTITFFVERPTPSPAPVPLALFILGSGAYSNFLIQNGRLLHPHRPWLSALRGRARAIFVEKVGVPFATSTNPRGAALGSTLEFRREHTLERWVEANSAALRAARRLPNIDQTRLLVTGHSEGGQVAATVAAQNEFVTAVACLGSGAGTQFYDSLRAARAGRLPNFGTTPQEQTAGFLAQWRDIQAHATDPDRMWVGHAYPYWATFMPGSVVEELTRTKARAFVALGSLENADAYADIDLVNGTFLPRGRDITAIVVEGANHGFQFPAEPKRDGWQEILNRVAGWFLGSQ